MVINKLKLIVCLSGVAIARLIVLGSKVPCARRTAPVGASGGRR